MQKIGSKIGFSDLSMGFWGRRPSFLALLWSNRGRGIDWRRFYSNRSRSWKVDFLASPPSSSNGVVFQNFFSRFCHQGPIFYRFYSMPKNSVTCGAASPWFLQIQCLNLLLKIAKYNTWNNLSTRKYEIITRGFLNNTIARVLFEVGFVP